MDGINTREVRSGPASAIIAESEAVSPRMRSQILEVRSVQVPIEDRRKGHGSRLLNKICSDADIMGRVLFLNPDYGDNQSMTNEQLEEWYGRYGFVRVQSEPVVLLARKPQKTLVMH